MHTFVWRVARHTVCTEVFDSIPEWSECFLNKFSKPQIKHKLKLFSSKNLSCGLKKTKQNKNIEYANMIVKFKF